MSIHRTILLAAVFAIAALIVPAAAGATCYSSTPASNFLTDSPADAEAGLAPEATAMRVSLDAACNVSFSYDVFGQTAPLSSDFYSWFIDVDNNASTGPSGGFVGADYAVGLGGDGGTILSRWNGAQFAGVKPIQRSGNFTIWATLDDLAASSGVSMRTAGGASWEGVYDTYFDWVPEIGSPWLALTPFFSSSAPSSVGSQGRSGCVVPGVRGLSPSSAKRKIRRAGCSVGSTRKRTSRRYAGRVMGTSPGKGSHLASGAKVAIYVGRRPRHSRIGASAVASPELATVRINQMAEHAAR